jgi:hypothetical protein
MQGTVHKFETRNNTYYLGYGRTAKTTYEQQQEQREEKRYMIIQKSIGILVMLFSVILSITFNDPEVRGALLLILFPIGLLLTATKQHTLCL